MKQVHLKLIGLVSGAAMIFIPAAAEVSCTKPSEIRCQSFLAGTYCQGWWRCTGYNAGNPLDDHEVPEQVFVKATPHKPWAEWVASTGKMSYTYFTHPCSVQCSHISHWCGIWSHKPSYHAAVCLAYEQAARPDGGECPPKPN